MGRLPRPFLCPHPFLVPAICVQSLHWSLAACLHAHPECEPQHPGSAVSPPSGLALVTVACPPSSSWHWAPVRSKDLGRLAPGFESAGDVTEQS